MERGRLSLLATWVRPSLRQCTRAAAEADDLRVHPRPKILRLELRDRVGRRERSEHLAVRVGLAVCDVAALLVEHVVRQVLDSELARLAADVVLPVGRAHAEAEPGVEGRLVDRELVRGIGGTVFVNALYGSSP